MKEEIHEVLFDPDDSTKVANIGSSLQDELRSELIEFLKKNKVCFTL